jgi:AcrR family transcriptional regulator
MAKVDLVRRAEIGRERRARTRAQILEAGAILLAERPADALTVDAVVDAAGVAKGTFYYHFQGIGELAAAVGATLAESFDAILTPARLELPDPVARLAFAFTHFSRRAVADPAWARLVVQSAQLPSAFGRGVRDHLRADLAEAIAERRIVVTDVELAVDIVVGVWLQVTRSVLARGARAELTEDALDAVLRALGATRPRAGRDA